MPPARQRVPTRRFGRTDLAMPVFTCGGMRYQHSWKDVPETEIPDKSEENVEAIVARALDVGIYHFETARGYGTSEVQLGKVLARLPRESLLVQTKVGPKETADEFIDVFSKSLRNLGLEYVDLLAVHGVNNDELLDRTLRPDGTLRALRQLQREGRCRFVGFSTHAPPRTICRGIESGEFDYVNLHWYFVNDFTWPAVAAASRRDMGVFIISPNDKGGKLYEPSEKLVQLCEPLSPMAFNDLYCLSRDEVHTLSLGVDGPEDFEEHIDALARYHERKEVSSAIAGRLIDEMRWLLGDDWYDHWHEGLPEWHEVPGQINVHEILRLWNYATTLDMVAYARMRYNLLGQGDHWFPGNRAEKADALDLSKSLAEHPFADRIPDILAKAHRLLYEAPQRRLSESES